MDTAKIKTILNSNTSQYVAGIVVDRKGSAVASTESFSQDNIQMVSDLCTVLCSGTRDMAKQLANPNETQGLSAGDDLHLLFTWLKGDLFFVTQQKTSLDPYALTEKYLEVPNKLRSALPDLEETYDKKWWQFWKS